MSAKGVELVNKVFPFLFLNVADVLYVRPVGEVVAFARLQIVPPSHAHRDIEEVASGVDSCIKSSCLFINMAVHFGADSERTACGLEGTDVPDNVTFFSEQSADLERDCAV